MLICLGGLPNEASGLDYNQVTGLMLSFDNEPNLYQCIKWQCGFV